MSTDKLLKPSLQKKVKQNVIKLVQKDIDTLHRQSYQAGGHESYTPVWYLMRDISLAFQLEDYDSSFDLLGFGRYATAKSIKTAFDDIINGSTDILGYTPTKVEHLDAEQLYQHLDKTYSDTEILDNYHYKVPRPITNKDIRRLFKRFQKALKRCEITDKMYHEYKQHILPINIAKYTNQKKA